MKSLVTGGTGMVGRSLVNMLLEKGEEVRTVSLDNQKIKGTKHYVADLTDYRNCAEVCEGMDKVYNLVGIKGSPKMAQERPADFFVPQVLFNLNMMKAAKDKGVKRYLYVSSYGVYAPSEVSREEDLWKANPSSHDWFGGWAKRIGEIQAEAYKKEGWDVSIVRPANIYGPFDNFDEGAMVVPSLIKRSLEEDPLVVWGDGTQIRDFLYTDDCARGMIMAMDRPGIYNLGSGEGSTIKQLASLLSDNIIWDTTKPTGDKKRVLDIERAKSIGWRPVTPLAEGVFQTKLWYQQNRNKFKRYNIFK